MTRPVPAHICEAERIARATLLRIAEPGVTTLISHVNRVGPQQALDDIRAGMALEGIDVDGLRHRLTTASGEADMAAAAAVGARFVCPGDEEWPQQLDDLGWVGRQSFGLWVLGPLSLRQATANAIAMVGTRTATDYGVQVAADMSYELAERGWPIVSGLAFGIDTAAHRGALAASGVTVGVLACGLDVPYPRGNRALFDRLAAEGLVVSEHPPGASPQRTRFLVRNRIIAALSVGTVVVEMALRSGARSTAAHAALLNRHVMCVPGPVTSAMSGGCHRLLRERPDTVLVTNAAEVVEQCGHMGELAPRASGPTQIRDLLGPTVGRVLEGVPVYKHASAESIAATVGVSVPVADASLAALASAGLVEASDGQWAMTKAGRADRRSRSGRGMQELELEWW